MKYSALFLSGLILAFSSVSMAAGVHVKAPDVKQPPVILKSGFSKEQHMAAEASCREIKRNMMGVELKECIKQKLEALK